MIFTDVTPSTRRIGHRSQSMAHCEWYPEIERYSSSLSCNFETYLDLLAFSIDAVRDARWLVLIRHVSTIFDHTDWNMTILWIGSNQFITLDLTSWRSTSGGSCCGSGWSGCSPVVGFKTGHNTLEILYLNIDSQTYFEDSNNAIIVCRGVGTSQYGAEGCCCCKKFHIFLSSLDN